MPVIDIENPGADEAALKAALLAILDDVWLELTGGTLTGALVAPQVGVGSGFVPAELLHVRNPGGAPTRLVMEGEGGVNNQIQRYSNNATGPFFQMRKARGTIETPVLPIQNDIVGSLAWFIITPTGTAPEWTPRGAAEVRTQVIAATPSATDSQGRLIVLVTPSGSTSSSEIMRLDHATGLSMFGANPVIDQNRHHRLRSYTVATLPSAANAGAMIYVSDGTSNKRLAVADGTNWRWPDGAIVS